MSIRAAILDFTAFTIGFLCPPLASDQETAVATKPITDTTSVR